MAQKVQVHLIDDLNGEEAHETVRFGLDGIEYEIDLTGDNANNLRGALSEYVDKARKATGGRKNQGAQRNTASSSGSGRSKEETQRIRQWAQDNGHNPSARGRITQSIIDAYNEAH